MAGDVQLAALQIEAAPLDYVVPDSAVVRLKSVHALFDGGGAGGAWLPAVELISDSGHTIALAADQGVSVAAGASADVSWFPGVKHAASGSTGTSTAPNVATFYRSANAAGDPPQTVGAGSTDNLVWVHAALPSDGSITGPIIGDVFVNFVSECITLESLYVLWEGGTFARANVLGTNAHIVQADMYAFDNNGAVGIAADGITGVWGAQIHPNAHTASELLHAYVTNGDSAARDVVEAWLVIYAWPITGYSGGIPGWPQ